MIRRAARHRPLLAAALGMVLAFPPGAPAGISLPQADGPPLQLEHPARRIITLAPNLAELAYDAGAGQWLVATVEYSDFPAAAARLPRIGDAFRFDLERILDLRPDLVIAWSSGNPASALARLETLGMNVWRTEVRRPEDIPELLETMASAAGLEPPPAAQAARDRLSRLHRDHAGKPPIRYFYQVAAQPLFTLSGDHLVSRGLAICGGRNVFADQPGLAPQVSREAVLAANPEVLIAPALPGAADPLAHWRQWPRMRAVQNGAFVLLHADEISRATRRTLDSVAEACRQLDHIRGAHPKEPIS